MTRQEEIEEAANEYDSRISFITGNDAFIKWDVRGAFVDGAKWADKTMIKKIKTILESTSFSQYYNKEFISDFLCKLKEYE